MQLSFISNKIVLTALLLVFSSSSFADPFGQNDLAWLKTMAVAARKTDYIGTFVYQYGNHVETSRITHISDHSGEYGRIEGLDGERREIIQHNDQVWGFLGDRAVNIESRQGHRSFPALLPEQLSLLNENYKVSEAEEVRVAGFHTHAYIFQPRDNMRYSHKMWAHSDSGLLLKAAVLDEKGRVVEQYAFTQLSIGGNVDRKWIHKYKSATNFHSQHPYSHSPSAHKAAQSVHKTNPVDSASGWQVDLLPAGFKKTMETQRILRDKDAPATQLVFSDGLAGISVFIEDLAGNPEANVGLSSQGVIQIYSKVSGSQLITVVGEVPPRTVMQIADSVHYRGK